MAQVENLKIGNNSYGITDANTLPALTAAQRTTLLSNGTYLGGTVESGKVFETDRGTFEKFTKTITGTTVGEIDFNNFQTTSTMSGKILTNGNGFVVYVGNAAVHYSNDGGSTWQTIEDPSLQVNDDSACAYGNGTYIVSLSNWQGNKTYTSTDGLNWTLRSDIGFVSLQFVNGIFIGVKSNNSFVTSEDGTNWSAEHTIPNFKVNNTTSVIYDGTNYYFTGNDNSDDYTGMYSSDLSTWTSFELPANKWCASFVNINGAFLITTIDEAKVYRATSIQGPWTSTTLDIAQPSPKIYKVGTTLFLANSDHYSKPKDYKSTDGGATWTYFEVANRGSSGRYGYAYVQTSETKVFVGNMRGSSATNSSYGTTSITTTYTYSLTELNKSVPMPALPTEDGTYSLKATIASGAATFNWVLDT